MKLLKFLLLTISSFDCANTETKPNYEKAIKELKIEADKIRESLISKNTVDLEVVSNDQIDSFKKNICEVIAKFIEETNPLFNSIFPIEKNSSLEDKIKAIDETIKKDPNTVKNFETKIKDVVETSNKAVKSIADFVIGVLRDNPKKPEVKEILLNEKNFKESHSHLKAIYEAKEEENIEDAENKFRENINTFIDEFLQFEKNQGNSIFKELSNDDINYGIGSIFLAIVSFVLIVVIVKQHKEKSSTSDSEEDDEEEIE